MDRAVPATVRVSCMMTPARCAGATLSRGAGLSMSDTRRGWHDVGVTLLLPVWMTSDCAAALQAPLTADVPASVSVVLSATVASKRGVSGSGSACSATKGCAGRQV